MTPSTRSRGIGGAWEARTGLERDYGKLPGNIEAIRPMKDGVIADFNITGK
jgi:hypothetical protein